MSAPESSRPPVRFGQQSDDPGVPRPFGAVWAVVGLLLILLVAGGMTWSALSGPPAAAQRPDIFAGSLVLADTRPLTVIDVATAQITVRLDGVNAQVGAANYANIQPVPVSGGTVLVNRLSGSFNFLGADDIVDDPNGPGVSLGALTGTTGAAGLASGQDAYIVRSAAHSTVSLVGPQTVLAAARETGPFGNVGGPVTPLGSATLPGPADLSPGGSVVAQGSLWQLYQGFGGCEVQQVIPVATSRQGVSSTGRGSTSAGCAADAVEGDGGLVGLAGPGSVLLLNDSGGHRVVRTTFTQDVSSLLPVEGASGELWYLAGSAAGWQLFGVTDAGGVNGPYTLSGFGRGAAPAVPVLAGGFLYTLDQNQSPQPELWTIDVTNGHMAPLAGVASYPILNSTEKDDFRGVQVILDGPRVVINNPGSLEAVVIFTDGSHGPVVVNKSQAVDVSATGPAELNATPTTNPPSGRKKGEGATPKPAPVPAVQTVTQQVNCQDTTQKPYSPQITSVTPSADTVLVQWSYQLLDQTDCEPQSWWVTVTALNGSRQPAQPTKVVSGEDQYLFDGLLPTTTYQVVVTAIINAQSTPSSPATFTTAARGPDAPLSVHTVADGKGDWVVSWDPCTTADNPNCVVPAAQWAVIGASCGGGFVGSPPTVQVSGNQSSATINAEDLQLLGDSLSFSVQGSLPSGLTGNPTSDNECTQAWEAPTAGQVSVSSSGSETLGGTITATVEATTSGDLSGLEQTHPSEIDFVYQLGAQVSAPTSATSATFQNVPPGAALTPSVTVYPAGHPSAAVTVSGPPFSQTLAWPQDVSNPTTVATVDPSDPNQGSFTVTLPADTPAHVEATNPDPQANPGTGPVLQCGDTSYPAYPPLAIDADHSFTIQMPDLVDQGGQCSLSFTLTDTDHPDPYGVPSPQIGTSFTIGSIPSYTFSQGFAPDCSNQSPGGNECGPGGQPWQLIVSPAQGESLDTGGDWTVDSDDPRDKLSGSACSTSANVSVSEFPYTINIPDDCPYFDMSNIDVTVSFRYLGQNNSIDAGYPDNQQGSPVPPPTTTTTSTTTTSTTTPCDTSSTSCTSSDAAAASASGFATPAGAAGGALMAAAALDIYRRRRITRRRTTEPGGPDEQQP